MTIFFPLYCHFISLTWHFRWLKCSVDIYNDCNNCSISSVRILMHLHKQKCFSNPWDVNGSNPRSKFQLKSYTLWFWVKERISFPSRGHFEFFSIFKLKSNSWRCHMTHFVQDVQRTSKVNFHPVGDKMMSRNPEPEQDWNEMRRSSVLCDICADPAWLTTGSAALSLSTDSDTVTSRGGVWKCSAPVQVIFADWISSKRSQQDF